MHQFNEANPISIILVKNGSRGDRLLFRYPFTADTAKETKKKSKRRNPYALTVTEDTLNQSTLSHNEHVSNMENNQLTGFSDKVLSNLFAVKTELCGTKFELKVNDVRFVGHPTLLNQPLAPLRGGEKKKASSIILFNIVFALRATVGHDYVKCYHDLSHRLGLAIRHEEYRKQYLHREAKIMLSAHEEASQMTEDHAVNPFQLILERSSLAAHLKQVYDDVCSTGNVNVRINKWIEVSFRLYHRQYPELSPSHPLNNGNLVHHVRSLQPYHTFLLLVDRASLLTSLAPDASPALRRLLHVHSPLAPLYTLAADADLTLPQVFMLVGHLVYWGKATIIYPVCRTNVYVLSPHCSSIIGNAWLSDRFSEEFPGTSLVSVLADFSLPTSLSDANPISLPQQQQEQVQQVMWLLRYGFLQQLHTYVLLVLPADTLPNSTVVTTSAFADMTLLGFSANLPSLNPSPSPIHQSTALALGHISGPPSESDIGSVCSEERSPSPGGLRRPDGGESDAWVTRQLEQHLSPAELRAVLSLPVAANVEDLKLFARLCMYFRGKHHLEEMMYRANLLRSQILQLLDKFRVVLLTLHHPHPHESS